MAWHYNRIGLPKVAYETFDAANKRVGKDGSAKAYVCEECGKWHVGKLRDALGVRKGVTA